MILLNPVEVYLTAVCLVVQKNQIIFGRSDGSLIIADAMDSIEFALFQSTKQPDVFLSNEGHFDAITCIFYPASVAAERYDADVVWVGSKEPRLNCSPFSIFFLSIFGIFEMIC